MFVKRAWYSAGWSGDLDATPLTRQFLGQHVALFRDSAGKANAVSALCPHRGADLGQGKVKGGQIECPFHGWRFDAKGACTHIPSQTADTPISPRARVAAYPVVEQQGIIWIWMDPETKPSEGPRSYPCFDIGEGWHRYDMPHVVYEGSFLNVVENALDGAHLAFAHAGSIGPTQDPLDPGIKVKLHPDGRGLTAATDPLGEVQHYSHKRDETPETIAAEFAPLLSQEFRFEMGGFVLFESHYANGKTEFILSFCTPKDETSTWFWAGNIRDRGVNKIGNAMAKQFFDTLVNEDKIAMSWLLPPARGAGGLPHPVFVPADKQTLAFRKVYGNALKAEGYTVPWATDDTPPPVKLSSKSAA